MPFGDLHPDEEGAMQPGTEYILPLNYYSSSLPTIHPISNTTAHLQRRSWRNLSPNYQATAPSHSLPQSSPPSLPTSPCAVSPPPSLPTDSLTHPLTHSLRRIHLPPHPPRRQRPPRKLPQRRLPPPRPLRLLARRMRARESGLSRGGRG